MWRTRYSTSLTLVERVEKKLHSPTTHVAPDAPRGWKGRAKETPISQYSRYSGPHTESMIARGARRPLLDVTLARTPTPAPSSRRTLAAR